MSSRNLAWLVLGLFFCSGATALVYEVVWSKLLSQMFGSTVYAQTVVLAVFMGGLAIGNRLFGKLADRLAKPVTIYGLLEMGIGVYALLFWFLDRLTNQIFVTVGTGIATHGALILGLKGTLSAGLLLIPTILMGGTLPLMAAWLQRSSEDAGRRSARFYSVNSLGAVAGSALAGFWLVRTFGMVGTLQIAAAVNIFIGGFAVLLSRGGLLKEEGTVAEPTHIAKPHLAAPGTLRMAGLVVAMTGAVSMGLEVLASRSMALIFGSSLQSFAIVLMAFILGIGLGSAWIASPKRKLRSSESLTVLLLCLSAGWVALLVFNIEQWVEFYRFARTGLGRTDLGYIYNLLLNSGIALVILGVPAALIGAVLPLMIRAVSREDASLSAGVGRLLTWNTLGAVVGVLFTGFILMPSVGLRSAFAVLALVLGIVAVIMAINRKLHLGLVGAVGVCLFVSGLFVFGSEGWKHAIGSGVFRVWSTTYNPEAMELRKKHMDIVFYEDAPDATVAVEESDGLIAPTTRGLRINGKPDAGTREDMGTQMLTAHLPMLVKPDAKDVFVLGLGSGVTAGTLLAYPVDQIVVAENCEPVIRAARLFSDWNHNVVDDPRTKMWCEDARAVLKLQPQRYDVIMTVPSNPWTAGIGSVFTKEYYELAASRLKPGGIVAQWFQVYETQDDIVKLVLRTFSSVYPYVEIWDSGADIVLLGSLQPWKTGPEVFQKGFEIERVRLDMWMMGIQSPEALLVKQLASQQTGFAIAGDGPIQSDLFPILEYAAPRAFFLGQFCRVFEPYDERTYQQLLAPKSKDQVLRTFSNAEVQMILSAYSSVNGELARVIQGDPAQANVPCVFQTPRPAPPPDAGGTALDLASKAFSDGNMVLAEQYIALALQMKPGDPMAEYVKRVIDREKQLRSGQINVASQSDR